ncbi:hypothetical protein LEA_08271 [human gut metagenome]|uniref:Uncharacterized protein n=1 Tax=human gut metagenome TaxID=408170 RepID=K1TTF1_9ZZZZ
MYRVDEIIESLGLERSVYYNRRQEAVLLFGYALWAIVIPREKVMQEQKVVDKQNYDINTTQ